MRITLNLDDSLMRQALKETGAKTKTEVLEMGLRIAREASTFTVTSSRRAPFESQKDAASTIMIRTIVDTSVWRGFFAGRTNARLLGLSRRGVGWVDAELVASSLKARARLWSLDQSLASVANDLAIGFDPGMLTE